MDFTIREMYLIYNIIIFLIFMINYIKFVDKEKNLNILCFCQVIVGAIPIT